MTRNWTLEARIEQCVKDARWPFASPETLDDFIACRAAEFNEVTGGVPVHNATKQPIDSEEVLKFYQKERPHYFPRVLNETLADKAFLGLNGKGNLSARAELLKEVGEARANEIARTYGLRSFHDTAPAKAVERKDSTPASTNPWSADYTAKHGAAKALEDRISRIKALPTEACRRMAKAAGVTLTGAPLRQ